MGELLIAIAQLCGEATFVDNSNIHINKAAIKCQQILMPCVNAMNTLRCFSEAYLTLERDIRGN